MDLLHRKAQFFLEQPVAWTTQRSCGQSVPTIIIGQHDHQIVRNTQRCLPQSFTARRKPITPRFMTNEFGKFESCLLSLWPHAVHPIAKLLTEPKLMGTPLARLIDINPIPLHRRES